MEKLEAIEYIKSKPNSDFEVFNLSSEEIKAAKNCSVEILDWFDVSSHSFKGWIEDSRCSLNAAKAIVELLREVGLEVQWQMPEEIGNSKDRKTGYPIEAYFRLISPRLLRVESCLKV